MKRASHKFPNKSKWYWKQVKEHCDFAEIRIVGNYDLEQKASVLDNCSFFCKCGVSLSGSISEIMGRKTLGCKKCHGKRITGHAKPWMAKYTWGDIKKACNRLGALFYIPYKDEEKCSFTAPNWYLICSNCSKHYTKKPKHIMNTVKCMGCSKTCAHATAKGIRNPALSKWTWYEIKEKCEELNTELICDEDLSAKTSEQANWHIICICKKKWIPEFSDLMSGKSACCGCIKSRQQTEVSDYVALFGHKVVFDRKKTIPPLQLDIYFPDLKIAIEYCGLYWHGELHNGKKARNKHIEKYLKCKEKEIRLITIFANEWLFRKKQTKAFLASILDKKERIFARNCMIKEVSARESFTFCEENHIQGGVKLKGYGLFYKEELLSVALFKKRNSSSELVRYTNKIGFTVVGGMSKLIAHYRKSFFGEIFTYSDNRWSSGNLYEKCGFTKSTESLPSYWYFKKSTDGPLFHRFKFRKSRLLGISKEETELEFMTKNGYDRIWDCGKVKWIL